MIQPSSALGSGMGRGLVAIIDNANTVFRKSGVINFLEVLNISYDYDTLLGLLMVKKWLFPDQIDQVDIIHIMIFLLLI
ncbi:MAG: hypothetical protein HWN67_05265 [Candidatus Helarchaeota archaeon]|nr:hypothetical protein [Candidatus Helarchaeota archaeon]